MTRPIANTFFALLVCLIGCGIVQRQSNLQDNRKADKYYLQPLIVQQREAYPETITGKFISLADFERSELTGQSGRSQLRYFSILPPRQGASLKFVVNITRTGAGAMEVSLPAGASLIFHVPGIHDFSKYTLLTMAIYARSLRDDLMIRISTDKAAWETHPMLIKPGWNNVKIDLARLKMMSDFNPRRVRTIRLWFSHSTSPLRINIDDIMLIDNRRWIEPVPAGMRLFKSGLDYAIHLPYRIKPVRLRQCDDGLWRLVDEPIRLILDGDRDSFFPPTDADYLSDVLGMGRLRVGQVELIEHNSIRLRIANTWFFSDVSGKRESTDTRKIRWEYTFYRDGKWITDVILNNVGGPPIRAVKIVIPKEAVFSDGSTGPLKQVKPFTAPVGRWDFLIPPPDKKADLHKDNFVHPARINVQVGQVKILSGDIDGDGFDQAQGCYNILADKGRCRFVLKPQGKLLNPVIRVFGMRLSTNSNVCRRVSVNCEGRAIREFVSLPDGSILFMLSGVVNHPIWVEATVEDFNGGG